MNEFYNSTIYAMHNEKVMKDFLKKQYPYFPKFKVYANPTNESIHIEYGEVTAEMDFENLMVNKKIIGKRMLDFYFTTQIHK